VITFSLADALPEAVARRHLTTETDDERRRRYETYLDVGRGCCLLKRPDCARLVVDAFLFHHHKRYALLAWVVMPNHVHVMIAQQPEFRLGDIVQSWKRHTAVAINRIVGRRGPLWRREYWDRYIRDEGHFQYALEYLHRNPVKAGLVRRPEDWPWSSAAIDGW
jgi:type I restriction enzyme R subunit/putative DNA methylase